VRGSEEVAAHILSSARLERLVDVMERCERLDRRLQGRLLGRIEWDTANRRRCFTLSKSLSRESFRQFDTVRFSKNPI